MYYLPCVICMFTTRTVCTTWQKDNINKKGTDIVCLLGSQKVPTVRNGLRYEEGNVNLHVFEIQPFQQRPEKNKGPQMELFLFQEQPNSLPISAGSGKEW